MSSIGPIAIAAAEIAKVIGKWMSSADKRRMGAAIESSEKYIQINEDAAISAKRKKKLLRHYKRRFFATNN